MSRRRRRHRSRRRRRHVMSRRRRRHVSRRRRRHVTSRRRRRRHVSRRRRRHVSRRRRRRNHKDRWRRSHKDGRRRRRRRNHKDGRWRRGKNVSDQSDNFRSQSDSAVAMISWRRRWRVCECGYDRSRGQQTNKQFFHGSLLLDGCCFLLRNGRRLSSEALDNPEKADCAFKRIGICEH